MHGNDAAIESVYKSNSVDQTTSRSCFDDAYDTTCKTIQASAREVALVTTGAATGAFNEFQKDPVGTVARAGATFAVGAGLGALAVAESPILAVGAVTAGATMTGVWAWDTLNPYDSRNQMRYSKIGSALRDTWYHSDNATFERSLQSMQEGAGPIALDVGLMALGAKGAQLGARHIPAALTQFKLSTGPQFAPATIPAYYDVRPFGGNSSGVAYGADDFAFFKARSGRASVNAGPPETIEARIAASDKAKNIDSTKATNHKSNTNHHASSDNWTRVSTPSQQEIRSRTLQFSTGGAFYR